MVEVAAFDDNDEMVVRRVTKEEAARHIVIKDGCKAQDIYQVRQEMPVEQFITNLEQIN